MDTDNLFKNGYVSFNTSDPLVEIINNETLDINSIDQLQISFDSIANFNNSQYFDYKKNQKYKKEILLIPNLKQLWFWKKYETEELNQLLYKIFSKYYDYNFNDLNFMTQYTHYDEGCFIEPHKDGVSLSRLCGILIYLNKNYDITNGGLLVLENKTTIIPEFGKVVLMDYTKNSIEHSVTPVLNGNRRAICAFIHKK
jgi:Rps23 Pro-64 3,4-dihydroxylase Tpa1-like proline 4-hydroxylase